MDKKLLVLGLFLDAAGVPKSINTFGDRKRVQKAIHLGQRMGVDLGYRFGWYLHGPYCPPLARDYYALNSEIQIDDSDLKQHALRTDLRNRLKRGFAALTKPVGVACSDEGWLELLASFDYLVTVKKFTPEQARALIASEKAHLAGDLPKAEATLIAAKERGLFTE